MGNLRQRLINEIVVINRAPLLTLWVSLVAKHQGYPERISLKSGKIVSSRLAQIRGARLGILEKVQFDSSVSKSDHIYIAGFKITEEELNLSPPEYEISKYLRRSFGNSYEITVEKLNKLAKIIVRHQSPKKAYQAYEKFRPKVASGAEGWAQKGILDLKEIDKLSRFYKR